MAIWDPCLRRHFYRLATVRFTFLLTQGLPPALSRCIGRGTTRDIDLKHLKMVLDGPVDGLSWMPAALFARGSAPRLFDERPRTARRQRDRLRAANALDARFLLAAPFFACA